MRRLLRILAAGAAVALAGCATAGKAREERLQRGLDTYHFQKPLDEVWQEARKLLADRGYQLADKDADAVGQKRMEWTERFLSPARETGPATESGLLQRLGAVQGRVVSTAAQALDTGWNQYGERYHLEGWSEPGGSRVVFTHVRQERTDRRTQEDRDVGLELELVRRLDPDAAGRIERGEPVPARS